MSPAQVRGALTAVIRRTIEAPGTFDADGWLRIGFCGHQPGVGETYISTGSLYLCSVALLPLGLAPTDPFWSAPPQPWTSVRAWSGAGVPDRSRDLVSRRRVTHASIFTPVAVFASSLTTAVIGLDAWQSGQSLALSAQIDRIFKAREFEPPRFGPARWLPDGTAYAIVERVGRRRRRCRDRAI